MTTWRIRAHGAFETVAQEPPCSLDKPLRAAMGKPPRRINRYIRLALIGAHRCIARFDAPLPGGTPLYMASEQGSVAEAVDLMDEIVLRGRAPKPMSFINVSSNMVGYYLAASLGLTGRNMNVAREHGAFGAMMELADLDSCSNMAPESVLLLGSVTECVWPLADHRRRCELPANTPLVESSYWLVADRQVDDRTPRLFYKRTRDSAEARDWLAAGEYWALDPHLAEGHQRLLSENLNRQKAWHAPLCHAGHPDAVLHAMFAALQADPMPRLHVVSGDPSGGNSSGSYQLMGVW